MKFLTDKIALVTGGTSGIGKGIAEALASAGADVVLCGRDQATTIKTAKAIGEAFDANCLGVPCDITNRDQVAQMIELATETGDSPIDILVNNAGVAHFAPIRELSFEQWDEMIATNLTGTFNIIKASMPYLHTGSFVINVESIAAVSSFATGAGYCASKAGMHALTQSLMLELRKEDIRVCSILSGSVNTRLEGPDGRAREEWKMEPADIAQTVLQLLALPPRALPSRIDIRPTKTGK